METAIFDHMAACTETEVQRMLPLVSTQRREQALRFKHTPGRFCCLKSWLMLREILCPGQPMGDFEYNAHGKPFIPGMPYFSISHCKAGIAVAAADVPVGIDIESIRRADEDLVLRTMNGDEQRQIAAAADRDRAFTRLWTRKEAVVKALGTGIVSFEQLQALSTQHPEMDIRTTEKENYIYSIAYGKLHCFGAQVPSSDV